MLQDEYNKYLTLVTITFDAGEGTISDSETTKTVNYGQEYGTLPTPTREHYVFEGWFTNIFSVNDGIWIGRGLSDQSLLHLSNINKEMTKDYKTNMGFVINESSATLCKFIDFISHDKENENEK